MLTKWLYFVISGIVLIWGLFKIFKTKPKYKLPPTLPGALPIIGHAHELVGDTENLWRMLRKYLYETKELGGLSLLLLGPSVHYMITDPDDALTAANSGTSKHFVYEYAKPWLGNGLVTGSGEIWKRHRRLLNPAFGRPVIISFLEVFNDQSRLLVNDVNGHIGMGPFDHTMYLRHRALETFCLTAFGINGIDSNFLHKYMDAVDEMLLLLTSRFNKVYLQVEFIYKLLGYKKKEEQVLKVLNVMSNEIIQKKRAAMENGVIIEHEKRYTPLLDLLLKLSDENSLTDAEIREEIDTAIMAGFDTSSTHLVTIFTYLGNYPEVQEKVYRELIDVLGPDRDVEKDDLPKLVYTAAVIKETLRVVPIAPVLLRCADKDIQLKNYTMPAGSHYMLGSYGIHRHPVWGDDCKQFRPERWLDVDSLPSDLSSAYGAFSWGKRSCIGKTYAMISMTVIIAHFLRRYEVKADISNLRQGLDVMLKSISGHEITIEKRNKRLNDLRTNHNTASP